MPRRYARGLRVIDALGVEVLVRATLQRLVAQVEFAEGEQVRPSRRVVARRGGPASGRPGLVRMSDGGDLDVELFSTGLWAGQTWTVADLDEIAANFERLKTFIKPPLKLGHDNQSLLAQH